jgi:hypothetical protein
MRFVEDDDNRDKQEYGHDKKNDFTKSYYDIYGERYPDLNENTVIQKTGFNNAYEKGQNQSYNHSNNDKAHTVFKYTLNGNIYESVIIAGKPFFVAYDKNELNIIDKIEQETRILRPPHIEEYPSKPYVFESKDELEKFVTMVKEQNISVDLLFWKIKEFVSKFIVHQPHILEYISALILFSYLQDKFPTIPYTMFVSDGGSGKSTIGNMFEDLGYRCVNMTDPTTANLFRIFGIVEAGQCTLVLDEAEKIDQDKEMMSILKTGYENGKRVQRINQFGKQEHFHTFGLKILIAERTPNPSNAKGVLDRTFIISNYKGKPELDIKEIRTSKTSEQKKIFEDLEFLRKSLFIYRLVHFNDKIADIDTGLEGRDKELCKPMLQLFYNGKSQRKIERIFEILLDDKNDRKANSLEREILEVVTSLFGNHSDGIIPFNEIWFHLLDKTNGTINEYKKHEMETEIHGTIFKGTLAKILRDRFGAKDPKIRNSKTRCLAFNIERIKNHYENYAKDKSPTKISCNLKVNDSSDSSDSTGEDQFSSFFSNEPLSLIDYKENTHENTLKNEKISYNNNENTSMGLDNTVITVTPVTDKNTSKYIDYNIITNLPDNLYRLYERGDKWACYNCNDKGGKWYMLQHNCKMNRK